VTFKPQLPLVSANPIISNREEDPYPGGMRRKAGGAGDWLAGDFSRFSTVSLKIRKRSRRFKITDS
jgi:hypothetical protein